MKIKCPSCTTVGRVPVGKIPAGGANIRCPSCSFVFFVGGPDGMNVLPDDAAPTGNAAALNASAVARVRAAAVEAVEAAQAVRTEDAAAPAVQEDAAPEAADPPSDAPAATTEPSAAPSRSSAPSGAHMVAAAAGFSGFGKPADFSGYGNAASTRANQPSGSVSSVGSSRTNQPSGSVSAVPEAAAAVDRCRPDNDASGLGVAPLPAESSLGASATPRTSRNTGASVAVGSSGTLPTPEAPPSPPVDPNSQSWLPGADGSPPRRRGAAWKVRTALGITYDFPDTPNLRRWLEGRPSLEEYVASSDGGITWKPTAEHAELADVRASGVRTSAATDSVRVARATGSVRAVTTGAMPAVRPGQRETGAPEAAAPSAAARHGDPVPDASAAEAAAALTDRMAAAARGTPVQRNETAEQPAAPSRAQEKEKAKAATRKRPVVLAIVAVVVAVLAGVLQFVTATSEPGVSIPNSPAGDQMRWVLTTIQGGSTTLNNGTIEQRFAPSVLDRVPASSLRDQLAYYDSWRDEYRPVRFARDPSPTLLELVVITNGGDLGVIRVETEPSPPHRLVGLNFRGAD